jgi:hypothetical protein
LRKLPLPEITTQACLAACVKWLQLEMALTPHDARIIRRNGTWMELTELSSDGEVESENFVPVLRALLSRKEVADTAPLTSSDVLLIELHAEDPTPIVEKLADGKISTSTPRAWEKLAIVAMVHGVEARAYSGVGVQWGANLIWPFANQFKKIVGLDEFRRLGSEHGRNCAIAAANHVIGRGIDYPKITRLYFEGELSEKEIELKGLGASEEEIEVYLSASADVATAFMTELAAQFTQQPIEDNYRALLVQPYRRLNNREFSLACLDFEESFTSIGMSLNIVSADKILIEALGGYMACCCECERPPFYVDILLSPNLKGEIMQHGIKFMNAWNDDPAMHIIRFIRRLS